MSSIDYTLETLLEMDGLEYNYPSGHWLKIEARSMRLSSNYPYEVKYSLTLHNYLGHRVMGYDNAHKIPGDNEDLPYDHMHRSGRIVKYQYSSAGQLLADFYASIDKVLEHEHEYET